jgi:ketosteroid isomerase-like protein
MSQENVELVRRTFAALERAFDAYWRDPRPIVKAMDAGELWPEWEEWFEYVHPEIVWQTVFLGDTFHGHRECVRVWDDYLRWADDYRATLEETEDLGGEHVYAVVALSGRGKHSGARMEARFYDVLTIRDGKIGRLEEYTSRDEALEASRRAQQS